MHFSYILSPALLALTAIAQPTPRGPTHSHRPAHPQGSGQHRPQGSSHPHPQGSTHPHPQGANAHHHHPTNAHGGAAHPQGNAHPYPQGEGHVNHHSAHQHPQGSGHSQSNGDKAGTPHPQGSAPPYPQGQGHANLHDVHHRPQGSEPSQSNGDKAAHPQSQGQSQTNGGSFTIHVENRCKAPVNIGIFGVSSSFQAQQHSNTFNIPSGGSHSIRAPFHGVGLRLSAEAQQGPSAFFNPQLLFEFGYSSYQNVDGTAYDISMMNNADSTFGMAVHVLPNGQGSQTCPSKICVPGNCPVAQGWTSPNQVNDGSPADAVCYKGKTNFQVIYCPDH